MAYVVEIRSVLVIRKWAISYNKKKLYKQVGCTDDLRPLPGRPGAEQIRFLIVHEFFLDWIDLQFPLQDPGDGRGMASDVRSSHDIRVSGGRFTRANAIEEVSRMGEDIEAYHSLGRIRDLFL
jgi:hypothetical protein